MSLTPALDQQQAQRIKDAIEKCGKNGGPHDYIPIEWKTFTLADSSLIQRKVVSRLLCKICFSNIDTRTLLENYPDVSYQGNAGS